jgi:hypothetical protein
MAEGSVIAPHRCEVLLGQLVAKPPGSRVREVEVVAFDQAVHHVGFRQLAEQLVRHGALAHPRAATDEEHLSCHKRTLTSIASSTTPILRRTPAPLASQTPEGPWMRCRHPGRITGISGVLVWPARHDLRMPDTELAAVGAWFAARGFELAFTPDEDESQDPFFWADLVSQPSGRIAAPRYGRGKSELLAAMRAKERHEEEQ